ncbi:hypothetical protein ANN_17477 [Periplaneta americana]|uniref:Uncharacterized protein n=1 Tax=Periplaneta americana TaxID=6978 RepID=A0ABQ8ST20_PERAM|nr:hypothetical protein ANN_17477 [Periplaneta americana]
MGLDLLAVWSVFLEVQPRGGSSLQNSGEVENRPIPGRPRISSLEEDALLFETVRLDPFWTANEIRAASNFPGSSQTVISRLRNRSIRSRRAAQMEILGEAQAVNHLAFATNRVDFDWRNVNMMEGSSCPCILGSFLGEECSGGLKRYGSEIWSLKKKDVNRIKATEMKFLRRTAGYTLLDRKRNEEILEQLEVESVEEKISRYKFNWLDHVRRMENSRIPKIMMQYKPRGHRRPGRPLRRLLDGAETGLQRPNS